MNIVYNQRKIGMLYEAILPIFAIINKS